MRKKLHWLPAEHRFLAFKTATLVYKFPHTGFPKYLVHIPLTRHSVMVIPLSFQSYTLIFINMSNSFVLVLLLMPSLFGMLFLMRCVHPPPKHLSESCLKPTCTTRHTHFILNHPLVFSVVLETLFCGY